MTTTAGQLHRAAQALAANDGDRAQIRNDVGFNQSDGWFGHGLAALAPERWTDEITAHAYYVLRKYRGQLVRAGIDFDEIAEPDGVGKTREAARTQLWNANSRRSNGNGEPGGSIAVGPTDWQARGDRPTIEIRFGYDPAMVEEVKQIPGRSFDRDTKTWKVERASDDAIAVVAAFAAKHGLAVDGSLDLPDERREEVEERRALNSTAPRRIEILENDTRRVRVVFPYDPAVKDELKTRCPSARFDGDTKTWLVEVGDAEPLRAFAREHGFRASLPVHQLLGSAEELRRDRREASAALEAKLDLDGFGVEPHPFQRAGIAYALGAKRTFIADEMGLGKTIQALGTIHADDAFPAAIFCPNNVVRKWAREARRALGPNRRLSFLNGKDARPVAVRMHDGSYELIPVNDFGADVLIANYDKLPRWVEQKTDEHGNVVKKRNRVVWQAVAGTPLAAMIERGLDALVLDESHYVKNRNAKRTAALALLADETKPTVRLALSGTPILNRPNELVEQLRILDRLSDLGGSSFFLKRYCAAHQTRFGYDTSGASNLSELHDRLREVGYVRRLKRDVLTELPEKQRETEQLPITNRDEYEHAKAELIVWLREQAISAALLDGLDLDEADAEAARKVDAALRAEILVRMNALRRLAATGMIPAAVEWIRDFLESSDEKLVVWAYHRGVQDALADALADYSPARIEAGGDKDAAAHRFQTDDDCRVIVCSISAGREGIELTAASNAVFVELEWRPGVHDQAEDRCYGRLDDPHGMNAYYLLAEETIYQDMADLIDAKRSVVDAATDGRVGTTGGSILGALVGRLVGSES